MQSIYAIVSAKNKTTYARLLRCLMSSEKNKKNCGPKVYIWKLFRENQLPSTKKVVSA
jgi:hypothetical protein